MATDKKSFLLYAEWIESFEDLTNEEAGKLIKHILAYVNDEDPELDDRLLKAVFIPMKQQLKRDLEKWELIRQKRSESGKKGGRPKKAKKANASFEKQKKQSKAKKAVDVDVNANVDVNVDVPLIKVEVINPLSFETFWTLYKKKIDKAKCEAKWKKLSDNEKQLAINYIPGYIKSQPDKSFRKNPATFLNNKAWENEIITNQKQNKDERIEQAGEAIRDIDSTL